MNHLMSLAGGTCKLRSLINYYQCFGMENWRWITIKLIWNLV